MIEDFQSKIDKILEVNPADLTPDFVIKTIAPEIDTTQPYLDPQSKEGAEKIQSAIKKEVDNLFTSLQPKTISISSSKIEELSCLCEGDSLYALIILEILKVKNESLYNKAINEGVNNPKNVNLKDIGIETNIIKQKKCPSSKEVIDFLEVNSPSFLSEINEEIFDNIDPLVLGKTSNPSVKKKRSLNILGFPLPIEVIMSGTTPVYFKLDSEKTTNQEAIDKINFTLENSNLNSKICDTEKENPDLIDRSPSSRIEDYDSNFFPDGDDPSIDPDCFIGYPEDPVTGDIIQTSDRVLETFEDFCDPPFFDFSGVNPTEETPEPPKINVKSIQSCIDLALEKSNEIRKASQELGRWQKIEMDLQEILYHLDIIYDFQENLVNSWNQRLQRQQNTYEIIPDIIFEILLYNDLISNKNEEILIEESKVKELKKKFLENNTIFTDNIFSLNVPQTEADASEFFLIFQKSTEGNFPLIKINEETKVYPISDSITEFFKNLEEFRFILIQNNFVDRLKKEKQELLNVRQSYIVSLSDKKSINIDQINPENLKELFTNNFLEILELQASLIFIEQVFSNSAFPLDLIPNSILPGGEAGKGFQFIEKVKQFSVRFNKIGVNRETGLLEFTFTFPADFGSALPYKKTEVTSKISITGEPVSPVEEVSEPDIEKIKIGNEYGYNGGLLYDYDSDFFRSVPGFYNFINIKENQKDVSDFYSFLEKVTSTNDSKNSIIQKIVSDHGILYGHLIEKSASPWLFFTPEERGDNDARDPSKLKPSSYLGDGEPNQKFKDFWGDFKTNWSQKYNLNKTLYIDPAIEEIKKESLKAAEGLANTLPLTEFSSFRIFESFFEIKKRKEQLEKLILQASQKRSEKEEEIKGDSIKKKFEGCNCGEEKKINDEENCPPSCCGEAGSDFNLKNFLISSPPSSDCPTIYQMCWWRKFSEHLTTVGLLPYPNGIPPIEDPTFFLAPGPSVRFGLKYWPVGYLPPSFIPIPVPNPIDGQPYIRIPLPMIWNVIDPILLPLPLGLGMIVIFIPFIGGFMPSPLVYFKEFITGSSLFLTGIRGPRFIPRRSDPSLPDPLEAVKQLLTFGVPDKLIPLPNFGLDNIDDPIRILSDIQSNYSKILDNVPVPGDISDIRELQEREENLKSGIKEKIKDYQKKSALFDLPNPEFFKEREELNSLIPQRKDVLKKTIQKYIENGIPNPKSIAFPKDKDKLKKDVPGIIKSLDSLSDMKSSFVPTKCPEYINIKDEIKEILKLLKITTPTQYSAENLGISNQSSIYIRVNNDPRNMGQEEFNNLTNEIRSVSLNVTNILLKGNKISVNKKIKNGAFHSIDLCDYEGSFAFPSLNISNSAPSPLDFLKVENPTIQGMYSRIMEGMSSIKYTPEDFSRFVRYNGENPQMVIRVKDLKKLISKKLGLTKKGPFDSDRPLDLEEPLISKFPHPEGPLCCLESLSNEFGNSITSFELTTDFPPKQDQNTQTADLGGIPQIKIPGAAIKEYIKEKTNLLLEDGEIDRLIPEINDIDSPKFINIQPQDIQKMAKTLVVNVLDPGGTIPEFLEITKSPVFPLARPTDMLEQISIGMGVLPPSRIPQSLLWQYFLGTPKSPLSPEIVSPVVQFSSSLLSGIPWPIVVLLGRNVINLINPLRLRDDQPSWRRMSLKNSLYVVYLDEFLRSASDVSGLFKFFLGAADPLYPITELGDELQKAFNNKKI